MTKESSDIVAGGLTRTIVTGGDAGYFHLVEELVRSIRLFRSAEALPVAVIDCGLTPAQRMKLVDAYGVRMLDVEWEYNFPAHRIRGRQHLKAQISRAFLDRHLPEFDLILWIDADAWVQDFAGVDLLFSAASTGKLAIVCQASRYSQQVVRVRWAAFGFAEVRSILYKNARKARVPERDARRIGLRPTLNSGVFALRRDAPHWEAFRRRQAQVIRAGADIFSSDQLALAMAVYLDDLPIDLLPDICNYMGPWMASDDGEWLVEHYSPHQPISIVHMAARPDQRANPPTPIDIPLVSGGSVSSTIRQFAWERACSERAGKDALPGIVEVSRTPA